MSKKILVIVKYLLMYLPVITGVVLFSNGMVNLFSSLLLFLGGYIAIKNTFDYRLVRKNIASVGRNKFVDKVIDNDVSNDIDNVKIRSVNPENIVGVKRTRRYSRVRRKY